MSKPIRPWNWCYKCHQSIDADDVFDGSEVECLGCGGRYVATYFTDGSWRMIKDTDLLPRSKPAPPPSPSTGDGK